MKTGSNVEALAVSHLDAIFSDALCLTRNEWDACDLVEETFARAFMGRQAAESRRLCTDQPAHDLLAYLYSHLHAAYTDEILGRPEFPESASTVDLRLSSKELRDLVPMGS